MVALVCQVIALGGGPGELSSVATAFSVGLLAACCSAGVAADRLPQRSVMIGVEAVTRSAPPRPRCSALTGALQLWHLAVVAASSRGRRRPSSSRPTRRCCRTLLPADELLAANGLEGTLRPVAQQALGPRLGRRCWSPRLAPAPRCSWTACLPGRRCVLPAAARARSPSAPDDERRAGVAAGATCARASRYMWRTRWLLTTLAVRRRAGAPGHRARSRCCCRSRCATRLGGGAGSSRCVLAAYGIGGAVGVARGLVLPAAPPVPDGDAAGVGRRRPAAGRASGSPTRSG